MRKCSKIPISPKQDITIIILQKEQNNRTTEHTELFELDEDSESVSYVITSGEQNKTKEEEGLGNSIRPTASAIIREPHTPTIIRGTRTQRGNRGSSLIRRGRRQNKR